MEQVRHLKRDRKQRTRAQLRILATTDLHAHLMPYDYFVDKPVSHFGLAMTASLVRQMRRESRNCLLFDNGDFLQGTPLSDLIIETRSNDPDCLHPSIAAMNSLGYDAACVGNHEFNYGLDILDCVAQSARFPLLSANVLRKVGATPLEDETLLPPSVILDRTIATTEGRWLPLRVGVIGLTPPQVIDWDRQRLANTLQTRDMIEAARAHVPELRRRGADIVVALCHSGIGAECHKPGMENAIVPLAAIPGIDAIIGGHTHLVFPGPAIPASGPVDPVRGTIHGTPVVIAGSLGSHLGVIDLTLERTDCVWSPRKDTSTAAWPIARRKQDNSFEPLVPTDPDIIASVNEAHEVTLAHIRRPIGETEVPLHSYFSRVMPDQTLAVIADSQRSVMQDLLAGSAFEHLPLVIAVAPFRAGGLTGVDNYVDIAPGPLTLRNAAELYPYPNTICAVEVSGAALLEWLLQTTDCFRQVATGQADALLLNEDLPSYTFDTFDGIDYRIDVAAPVGSAQRIRDPKINGQPLAPNARIIVAASSYRAGGGGDFGMLGQANVIRETRTAARDILINHIRRSGPINPAPRDGWRLAAVAKSSGLFLSNPRARRCTATNSTHVIDRVGAGPEGFDWFRLKL
ncbi:bifunctional 2',3'-cyclic-nucleotide 2'-phosphodiesterase/3'-nucleotidase [Loktanella sp. IMCC34160]|uniref:bifunctional 2',3'-cyclic-nucleotide 2'-phosphodiesterase/3'-nucleotidase n=1 Tax=Loktanella sp. IMCC34160 TaxID=2510646 RepID=UPI0013EE33EF|nr:bifunctional 2',3'-cyclic-nucleotide 2'-phosphodiesterase/3'-nucleotidase [Loktanella sp. IMCC34160]